MTHVMSDELRKLADRPERAVWEGLAPYKEALRRAADALDEAMVSLSVARTELCEARSKDGIAEVYAERDELRRQLTQANQDRLDVTEAARAGNKTRIGLVARAERAEAQAKRYRKALEKIMEQGPCKKIRGECDWKPVGQLADMCPGGIAEEALREPEEKTDE